MTEFVGFPKIARLSRECIITEKLDGTNAQVCIRTTVYNTPEPEDIQIGDFLIRAGSRTRWITPDQDNYGFAAWVRDHAEELLLLGVGQHFGEWWGQGIQRGYGLTEKRFSLFNASRWGDDAVRPECCHVVPTLYAGSFDTGAVDSCLRLLTDGSIAAPGFKNPEGVIVFHTASGHLYKKTIQKDEAPKGQQ